MIRVLFFASLREAVDMDAWTYSPNVAGSSVRLSALLAALKPALGPEGYAALTAENVRIAVNQEFVDGAARVDLKSGDEVAFLPPVTGG
ncbi:MAG: MoaD/ThiS family protein [Gammaproteobacteria bacterium]|nr:MoaD/ThiS family protein [Gammaproteobacteria bacterium]MDE0270141.1 MoaD/ThiS family protein [Gammaproteobacteria bacterium]